MKADYPSEAAYRAAAWMLKADVAALKAIATVEAGSEGAFLASDEPVVLFERHKFREHTAHKWDASHPDLSNAVRGGYGRTSEQHTRLARAAELDREAALKSASWGLYQIMGENYREAGFGTLQRFINAMYEDVDEHLRALVMLIRHNAGLLDALQVHDWKAFAYLYNGPRYAESHYDTRMAQAYVKLAYLG